MKITNKGFSLIELMVVVAIIGVLASIAVPSVNKYMAKARQAEAKSNLGSYYTSQKAFFTEYNIYAGQFGIIGFVPEGRMRYRTGVQASTPDAAALLARGYTLGIPAAPGDSLDSQAYCGANGAIANGCTLLAEGQGATMTGTVPGATFTAMAAGTVRQGAAIDTWTINQLKALTNTVDGTQ